MKVISIVGTVGLPACYGGFESLIENLTKNSSGDIKYKVFCSSQFFKNKINAYNNADLIYIPLNANGIQSIFYDIISLIKTLFYKNDVTLILGVSGCLFLPFYKFFSKAKVITNIDGLEWKRDKWGAVAKWFLKRSEYFAVKYSDIIISDNQAIADYVNQSYNLSSEVIAYGGDHAIISNHIENTIPTGDYYLSICRIEPENNISLILESFSASKRKIKFIGNWKNSVYGQCLYKEYSQYENIELIDPIYDISTLYNYRINCKAYIHGHSAGGTNPSLVEAMHIGRPILAFDCDFNRYSTDNKALYFSNDNSLLKLIEDTDDNMLVSNSEKMKEIAIEKYTWSKIATQYESLY
ncbi:DUF1972 domain-containing protein [Providencia rettgeri]|uniref:Domain of uncharacterized function (DUF1972) n=1 Tax=Providencia rettgeri TaxID=587 RepID=A0A379FYC1_PRORE|nr:DUF1972 domain-containing protein [Providencia rettgeri]QXB06058.1 DUF1972 domain-containing protein [Providencia rettgeri]SUC33602.1 Domain of uncharacterised function (DUF1972) [Providencia rettgeri]